MPFMVPGYEILGELGKGGMGVVYKARQIRLNRLVALKMILHAEHASKDERRRFKAEAEAVARLQHPNIIQIYEVGEHRGLPYFSLEYCAGGSLEPRLNGTPWDPKEAARLVEALARAMAYAHQRDIVHRDLKPANVLLGDDGAPKITDFGLAKRLDVSVHTQSGAVMGTPSYMAPEQAQGRKEVGPAADVYALGTILYELLVGRPPFKAATALDTVLQVISDEPVALRRLQSKVPRDLETICHKCLQKEIPKRYASAAALADDLQRFIAGEPVKARRVRPWERAVMWARRRPAAAALVGVLLVIALALPITAVVVSVKVAQKREAARAEVRGLLTQGQTAALNRAWEQAEVFFNQALQKVDGDPALAEMHKEVKDALDPVKDRLAAQDTLKRFQKDRDEALFYATLAGGEDAQANLKEARARAWAALQAIDFSPDGDQALALGSAFFDDERTDVKADCYVLLLTLAEVEAKDTSHKPGEGLERALALLHRAEGLGLQSRAIHLRRARYLTQLREDAAAKKEASKARAPANDLDFHPQDHFLVGQELYTQGDLDKANGEFHRALRQHPGDFWTHYFLGICNVASGNPAAAVAHFTVCQSQRKDLVWVYLLRGFAYGQLSEYPAAEADFDIALSLKPTAAARYVLFNNRGVMRVGQEDKAKWAQGVEDLSEAAKLRPDHYQAHASLAEAYRLKAKVEEAKHPDAAARLLEEAARLLDKAIRLAVREAAAGDVKPAALAVLHHSRAHLYLKAKQPVQAVSELKEAVRLAEENKRLAEQMEADRGRVGRAEGLVEAANRLLARMEADRGRVLHRQEDFDGALAAYDRALKADKDRVEVHRWRGEVLLAHAAREEKASLAAGPGDKGEALARRATERYKEAGEAFDAYLQKDGEPSAAVYKERALAREKLFRHGEAASDYGRALEAGVPEKDRGPLLLARGKQYLALGAAHRALPDFEEALHLLPGNAEARLGCAHARVMEGDLKGGLADADEAVKGDPKEPTLWHGSARVYALAAARVKAPSGREYDQAWARAVRAEHQHKAIALLRQAVRRMTTAQRRDFRRDLVKDAALKPLMDNPEFTEQITPFIGLPR
jgi:tetratricopeptide (TPR) repeat protein/tRNA A-37 threonylcarbamoyl transferase component Bud32